MDERFETFTVLIADIARSIYKIKTAEMSEFDLKGSHVSCLYYLFMKGELTAKELCGLCGEDKANISRSLAFLEEGGYLTCVTPAAKRYHSPMRLTEKGREVGRRIAEKVDRILALAGEGMSEEDRAVMYRCLALVGSNLQKICGGYAAKSEDD